MAHPYHHALSSLRQWGGSVEDYQRIHGWFDESKMIIADFRHRALRHHARSEEHTSELQSQSNLVCRLLLEKKKKVQRHNHSRRHCESRCITYHNGFVNPNINDLCRTASIVQSDNLWLAPSLATCYLTLY